MSERNKSNWAAKVLLICILFTPQLGLIVGCTKARNEEKLKKDKASLLALARAMEAYMVDWNVYPSDLNRLAVKIVYDPPVQWMGGAMVSELGPYIGEIPTSAFGRGVYPKCFPVERDYFWFIWYPGPDGDFDLNFSNKPEDVMELWRDIQAHYPSLRVLNHVYDPTNGTLDGDIIRWKQ